MQKPNWQAAKKFLSENRLYLGILGGLFICAVLAGAGLAYAGAHKNKNQNQRQIAQSEIKPVEKVQSPPAVPEPLKSEEPKAEPPKSTEPQKPAVTAQPKPTVPEAPAPPEVKSSESVAPKATVSKPKPTSTPAPTPVSTPPAVNTNSGNILDLVNAARAKAGLGTVKMNAKLNSAALAKSKDMFENNYFSHAGDFEFVKDAGYDYQAVGSNIAMGSFKDTKAVFDAWMGSPGHRANILADFGKEIGYAQYGKYFTFFIAKPR